MHQMGANADHGVYSKLTVITVLNPIKILNLDSEGYKQSCSAEKLLQAVDEIGRNEIHVYGFCGKSIPVRNVWFQ